MMQLAWVFQSNYQLDPGLDLDTVKSVGPFWGSWKTWRSCGTDNVICHDFSKCRELLNRGFQDQCNFYVPNKHYLALGRPSNIFLYDGDFDRDLDDIEDIISCHLASSRCEILLLMGFDLSEDHTIMDLYQKHKEHNWMSLIHSIIKNTPEVQWVAVDHATNLEDRFQNLPNLTCDAMTNVLKLLDQ